MKAKRAVSYLRVSGKGQVGGDGFPRQRRAVASFAKRTGLDVIDEFTDAGVSGTRELADRPGLAKLLDRLESNGIRIVVIERADRLARDLMIGEVILGEFRKLGVRVLTSDGDNLTAGDSSDPTRKLIRQVLGAVAEFDKDVTTLKLRAARERIRAKTGRCEGRKPFGFYDGETEVIGRMRQLRRKPRGRGKRRMSFAMIADAMNKEGIPTRTGKPWHWQVVRRILARTAEKGV